LRCELRHDKSAINVTMVQLPALNTPQFSWVESRLPRRPRPVPPIYQPEVAARAIMYAAEHPRRREYWVGASTVATIVANTVVPGLLDRYLAATGFDSQQADGAPEPGREPNLWHAVDDTTDFGARGDQKGRIRSRSAQWWLTTHRAWVYGGTALLALGAARVVRARTPASRA
jgi:hypothetical protein